MTVWVRIDGGPRREFARDRDVLLTYGGASTPHHAMLIDVSPINSTAATSTASNAVASVSIANSWREALELYPVPLVGARLTIFDAGDEIFAGVITVDRHDALVRELQAEA